MENYLHTSFTQHLEYYYYIRDFKKIVDSCVAIDREKSI